MNKTLHREISVGKWTAAAANAGATTLSRLYRPALDLRACTYKCAAEDFLSEATYPVRFTDPTRTRLVNCNDPQAKAISIDEYSRRPDFVKNLLDSWYKPELGRITHANLITMHCIGCGRRIVIDGVHRIVWIAANGRNSASVDVAELSGRSWPKDMPDMNVVCACMNK